MTSCYRVRMRDILAPFRPIVCAETPSEAFDKAAVLAAQIFGSEASVIAQGPPEWLHSTGIHKAMPYTPTEIALSTRRITAMQLRGER